MSFSNDRAKALLKYAVGVGSEGGGQPGLGLAGWAATHPFDPTTGAATQAELIKQNGGYSVGVLQTDFGQRHDKEYLLPYYGFLFSFLMSSQAASLTDGQVTDILNDLPLQGHDFKEHPEKMLNKAEFSALDTFLRSPEGIEAANILDRRILDVDSRGGVEAANLAANLHADDAAQENAATVAMKMKNRGDHPERFISWLKGLHGTVTTDDIRGWVQANVDPEVGVPGINAALNAGERLRDLEVSTNPVAKKAYEQLSSNVTTAAASLRQTNGLYAFGDRMITSPTDIVGDVLNALTGGQQFPDPNGRAPGWLGADGNIRYDPKTHKYAKGTFITTTGEVVTWSSDGTAFLINAQGEYTKLNSASDIQFSSPPPPKGKGATANPNRTVTVTKPDGGRVQLSMNSIDNVIRTGQNATIIDPKFRSLVGFRRAGGPASDGDGNTPLVLSGLSLPIGGTPSTLVSDRSRVSFLDPIVQGVLKALPLQASALRQMSPDIGAKEVPTEEAGTAAPVDAWSTVGSSLQYAYAASPSRLAVPPPAKPSVLPPATLHASVSHQPQVKLHLDGSQIAELLLPKIESTLIKYMTAMADGTNDIAFASSPGTARG